jgi:DnaK suppressor protein
MAAKKTIPKSAPKKSVAKPAVKPSKPAAAAKKKPVKAAAPTDEKKPASGKASAPLKKAAAPKTEPQPAVVEAKPAPQPKVVSAPAKKAPLIKPRSSVVDFPAPPAPVKPPFVPPKAAPALSGEPVAHGSNGSHSPAFVQKQRQRLLDLRDDLVDAVSGMARDTIRNAPEGSEASGSGQHQGDAGSDAYDRDFALSVLAKEQDALYEIEQALRRIQIGSYGICEMSSRKIPQARLEVIPFARLTVECQAQWEKEYGNRRFRPSNEVGFSGGKYAEDEDSEAVSLDEDDD